MIKYLYENHLGGYYLSDEELDYDDLYCEQCHDTDFLVRSVESKDDLTKAIFEDLTKYDTWDTFKDSLKDTIKDSEEYANELWGK